MTEARDPALEARFVAALRARDERAFTLLVRQFQDRIYNLCRRMLGNPEEARDLTQEVFVTVFEKIESYRGDSALGTWIYRIAANQAKNRIKYLAHRQDRRRQSLDQLLTPPTDSPLSARPPRPDEALSQHDLAHHIDRALSALDEDQRLVVVLRDIEGESYEAIAEITGVELGTVKSRLNRARTKLQEALAAHHPAKGGTS